MAAGDVLQTRYAIQAWYKLRVDEESLRVSCDDVVKVPLDLRLTGPGNKHMSPCVVITTDYTFVLKTIKIVIETNEGFTVEPVKVFSESHGGWVYILALPPKTTGLKNVKVFGVQGEQHFPIQVDLVFDIMYPPYNYEGAALENISKEFSASVNEIRKLSKQLEALTTRVEALEQKP